MSKLKIDLDSWLEQARNDDPTDVANIVLEDAAEWVFVMLEEESLRRMTSIDDKLNTMRKRPQLVGIHALANAISRFEHTYRTLKIEELRLQESIANSLGSIARAAASSEGKNDE